MLGMLARLSCQGECETKTGLSGIDHSVYCILNVLLVTPQGVMQDRCAHLLSTLQQCPLLRVSVMSSESVCPEGVAVDMPEQQECWLSVSDLLNSLHSVGCLLVERCLH